MSDYLEELDGEGFVVLPDRLSSERLVLGTLDPELWFGPLGTEAADHPKSQDLLRHGGMRTLGKVLERLSG